MEKALSAPASPGLQASQLLVVTRSQGERGGPNPQLIPNFDFSPEFILLLYHLFLCFFLTF